MHPILRPATGADASIVAVVWRSAWLDGHAGHVPDALLRRPGRDGHLLATLGSSSQAAGGL